MGESGKLFYGWIIVSISFLTLIVVCGSWSAFSIFMNSLQNEFNWDRASISLAMSIGLIVYGSSLPFVGKLIDRYGARKVILLASVSMGVSTILLNLISHIWHFYFLYGVCVAIGYAGAGLIANTSLVRNWFRERSELALSVMQSGLPFGQLLVVPFAAYLIVVYSWRIAYLILGFILCVIIPMIVFFISRDSSNKEIDQPFVTSIGVNRLSFQNEPEINILDHIKTRPFLTMIIVYFICGFTDIPIVTHMAPFITDVGFSAMIAAYILSIIGGATWIGTLIFGFLSQRFDRRLLLVAIYFIRTVTFCLLLKSPYMSTLILFSIFFGLTQFSMVPLISAWIGDNYGQMLMGRLFGTITLIHAIGASSGTYLDGLIFNKTNSYKLAFIVSSALAFVASTLVYFIEENRDRTGN